MKISSYFFRTWKYTNNRSSLLAQVRGLLVRLRGGSAAGEPVGAHRRQVPPAPLTMRGVRGASAAREPPETPSGKLC